MLMAVDDGVLKRYGLPKPMVERVLFEVYQTVVLELFELTQQPLRFLLRQPASNHRLRYLLGGLAIKLMAFGESAFVQPGKGSTHTGVNGRSPRLDDD
jgi:hypothetical protein